MRWSTPPEVGASPTVGMPTSLRRLFQHRVELSPALRRGAAGGVTTVRDDDQIGPGASGIQHPVDGRK
jgi:hypothetical protein